MRSWNVSGVFELRFGIKTDYSSRSPTELEADAFSADLLMPMPLFREELRRFRNGFCTLDDLGTLANRLGTSLTSTAKRYIASDGEACTIFFSRDGRMHWGEASEDIHRLGLYWIDTGERPPKGSKTAALWDAIDAGEPTEKMGGRVRADVWFKWPKVEFLWEEAMPLGNTGRAITQLTPDD